MSNELAGCTLIQGPLGADWNFKVSYHLPKIILRCQTLCEKRLVAAARGRLQLLTIWLTTAKTVSLASDAKFQESAVCMSGHWLLNVPLFGFLASATSINSRHWLYLLELDITVTHMLIRSNLRQLLSQDRTHRTAWQYDRLTCERKISKIIRDAAVPALARRPAWCQDDCSQLRNSNPMQAPPRHMIHCYSGKLNSAKRQAGMFSGTHLPFAIRVPW